MRTTPHGIGARPGKAKAPVGRTAPVHHAGRVSSTLFGLTRRLVLGLLYGQSSQAFYAREVARRTGGAMGAVQRELQELAGAGIISRSEQGRQVYYQANRQCPVFEELRGIIAKTSGLGDVLRAALSALSDGVDVAFVFGSVAKGSETSESDVDVFVVGDVTFGAVVDAVGSASTSLGREVNPVVQSAPEFARRVAAGDHFVSSVLAAPRMFVIGDDDVLGRLGAERVADPARLESPGNRRAAGRRATRPARQPIKRRQP